MSATTGIRKAAALLAGGGVFGSAVYMSYHIHKMDQQAIASRISSTEPPPPDASYVNNPQRNLQYQNVAHCYDDKIGKDELYTGINFLRRALLRFHCKGTVLEVAAGTGRNLPYYPMHKVQRVLLTDSSVKMLEITKQKISKSNSDPQRFAVVHADSARLDFLPNAAFDTVVDTFGLCSYDDPVAALQEMARVCKKTGKILLLEHGRSTTWDFITKHLDKHAEQHAANWGCVWNRDLDSILEQSGLEIETLRKFHFGTTYYVVCRPKTDGGRLVQDDDETALYK